VSATPEEIERWRVDTAEHISKVQAALLEVTSNLTIRAAHHDLSKLREPELSGYAKLKARLDAVQYGTPEYAAALEEGKEPIAAHYAANSHHPQHYENGIAGMSLLDIIEMFCDWYAAGQRTKNGSLKQSLAVNRTRFGADPVLAQIFENTRVEMGWE
jgi:hypothetical protein